VTARPPARLLDLAADLLRQADDLHHTQRLPYLLLAAQSVDLAAKRGGSRQRVADLRHWIATLTAGTVERMAS